MKNINNKFDLPDIYKNKTKQNLFPNLRLRILFSLVTYLVRTALISRFHWHVQQTSACECSILVVNILHSCTLYINPLCSPHPPATFHTPSSIWVIICWEKT